MSLFSLNLKKNISLFPVLIIYFFSQSRKLPQKILLSHVKSKAERIFVGPDVSAILFANGDIYVCGSNNYNKLGFGKTSKISAFVSFKINREKQKNLFLNFFFSIRKKFSCVIKFWKQVFRPHIQCSSLKAVTFSPWVAIPRARGA